MPLLVSWPKRDVVSRMLEMSEKSRSSQLLSTGEKNEYIHKGVMEMSKNVLKRADVMPETSF